MSGSSLADAIPYQRWDLDRVYSPEVPAEDRTYARFAAYLQGGVEGFDASAFQLSRLEAVPLDPQARILLELSTVRTTKRRVARIYSTPVYCRNSCHEHARASGMLTSDIMRGSDVGSGV